MIFSSKIVEPLSGASGINNLAGVSLTVDFDVKKTVRLSNNDDRIVEAIIAINEFTYSTSRISNPVE